jgi:hypothetical protein
MSYPGAIVAVLFKSGVDFFKGFGTEVGDVKQRLRVSLWLLANRFSFEQLVVRT